MDWTAALVLVGLAVAACVLVAVLLRMRLSPAAFREQYGPWCVVFGATSGIGRAVAERCARCGLDLVLVSDKRAPLEALAVELMQQHGRHVVTLDGDVSDVRTVLAARELCAAIDVGLVFYNASVLLVGAYESSSLEDKMALLDVNVKGAACVCDVFGTKLAERRAHGKGAGLLLVSSLLGITGARGVALYAASKAFLTALAGGLWSEWQDKGIAVRACVLGPVDTPKLREQGVRPDAAPGIMSADEAAERCLRTLAGVGPRHVIGWLPAAATVLVERLLPRSLGVAVISENTSALLAASKRQ